jgi:hypothetical protein
VEINWKTYEKTGVETKNNKENKNYVYIYIFITDIDLPLG